MTRTTVVTGAAGGSGSELSRRLRREGGHVIGLDVTTADEADDAFTVDLADGDALAECAAALGREYAVTSLIHCATIQPLGGAGDTSPRAWLETVQVNVVAADVLVGALRKSLVEHHGSVVVISSVHGRATTPGIAAYATTKAALEGWVRAAALDLAPDVRVNARSSRVRSTPPSCARGSPAGATRTAAPACRSSATGHRCVESGTRATWPPRPHSSPATPLGSSPERP